MAKKLGKDCVLYRCATVLSDENTPATATWVEVDGADVSLANARRIADLSTRANGGNSSRKYTLADREITITTFWNSSDTGLQALLDAAEGNAEIALAMMDGDIEVAGAEGLVGNFSIDFDWSQPLAEGSQVTFKAILFDEGDWHEVSGS